MASFNVIKVELNSWWDPQPPLGVVGWQGQMNGSGKHVRKFVKRERSFMAEHALALTPKPDDGQVLSLGRPTMARWLTA